MGVKVYKHLKIALFVIFQDGFLGSQDGWILVLFSGVPLPIQIDSVSVKAPLTSGDPISVKHWNDFEHIVVQEDPSLNVTELSKLVYDTLKHVLRRCLSAMHPARQEYYGLLLKVSVLRGDGDLVHWATLKTIDQLLLVEVDILIC